MDQKKQPEDQQRQPEDQQRQPEERHREIASFVEETKDTPGMALDPALERAGIDSWRAAVPGPTT